MTAAPLRVLALGPAERARLSVDRGALRAASDALADVEPVALLLPESGAGHFDAAVAVAGWLRAFPAAWFVLATRGESAGHPYNFARRLASLDQLSGGRIGWRHEAGADVSRSDDYVRVVQQLLRSWPRETIADRRDAPHFADVAPIRRLGVVSSYAVAGPLNVPSSPQLLPVHIGTDAAGADPHRHVDLVVRGAVWESLDGRRAAEVVRADSVEEFVTAVSSGPRAPQVPQTLRERLELTAPVLTELPGASARFDAAAPAEAS
ncbi:hypothetical protein ACTU3I_07205 [Microbacterium sp. RD1]|uniref:hypothetical protein n=1 Tax=Microbacterium sp. RD1 TaxID=3457313 RepID=UPI003FA559EC